MALVDLKSNLANFRADFPQEGKLKSPGNLPGSMPTDIQKKSPNNAPTQRYINDIKVERIIKPKPSPVNPIATTLKDKTSNIVTIATVLKDKVSTISPLVPELKDKTSQVNPIKTEVKSKSSNIAPIKSEVRDKTSPAAIPGEVNFFNDTRGGAKGFTTRATDRFNSNIIGVNSGLYDHGVAGAKAVLMSAFTTPTISTQHNEVKPTFNKNVLEIGTYKIDNQLGSMGSPFKYLKDGAIATKKFSETGYSAKRRYNDSIKSVKGQSDKSLLYAKGMEKNSPSAIDAEYARYDLQEESFNPTYMKQPFVVRSIGRRWGFRTSPGAFDDGLISGGMTTAVERSALDTARIAKWMASPKGLLWVVKQVGLGLTNPKVEAIGGALTSQTRIHSGIASLLSVPTTAFGIHFTRHGVPFLNDIASYENVIKAKQALSFFDPYSRLINLKKELFFDLPSAPGPGKFATSLIQKAGKLRKAAGFGSGTPILSLSGLAGPGSVYGIGLTTIKRHYNSRNLPNDTPGAPASEQTSKINPYSWTTPLAPNRTGYNSVAQTGAQAESFLQDLSDIFGVEYKGKEKPGAKNYNVYQFKGRSEAGGEISKESKDLSERKAYSDKQYAGNLRANTQHDFDPNKDNQKNASDNVDGFTKSDSDYPKDSLKNTLGNATKDKLTPGAKNTNNGIADKYIETNAAKIVSYPNSPNNPINDYITLAYNKLPNQAGVPRKIPNDFRNDINKAGSLSDDQKKLIGLNSDEKYFEKNDIQNRAGYGLGSPGRLQKFKPTDPTLFIKKGNDFGGNRTVLTSDTNFEGDMITALDIGSGDPYPGTHKDFIKFFFEDATEGKNIMAFRATLNGFTDSFQPGWDPIAIMGRPDSAYLYSSFERTVSFNFTVAATTRSEMIPMWRKLNYLSTYTMPDIAGGSKPSGPMMRFTIGDMFYRTPGFLTSLSYTIPDDATWDIAEEGPGQVSKQLPTIIEVSVSLTVIGDYRPQKMGRAYSLSPNGTTSAGPNNWLGDADTK